MKRLGFHTLRDKATDTLGDKLSRQLQEDVAPKMSDEEAFSFAEFNAEDAERGGYSDYSYWKSTLRAFFQNKIAVFFLFVMVAVLLFTFIQPYLPGQKDPILIHNDQWGLPLNNIPPSKEFWFGTNSIGQDLWARIWAGTRTSLFIGFSVALVEAVVGILVGVLWGYVRKLDFFFTELYNVLDNIPQTLLLILISYVLKPGVSTIIFALSLTGWLVHPQPDHHYPRPGLQSGLPVSGHFHRAYHRQEPAALYGVRHHHAHGACHSLRHRQ